MIGSLVLPRIYHDFLPQNPELSIEITENGQQELLHQLEKDYLDAALLPFAETARSAALGEGDAFGLVRNVCGAPYFDRPGVAPEGQAFHILMEAARAQLR